MGSLSEALNQAVKQRKRRSSCLMCSILADLDEEDRANLSLVIDRQLLSADSLADTLNSQGISVSPTSIRRHKRHG